MMRKQIDVPPHQISRQMVQLQGELLSKADQIQQICHAGIASLAYWIRCRVVFLQVASKADKTQKHTMRMRNVAAFLTSCRGQLLSIKSISVSYRCCLCTITNTIVSFWSGSKQNEEKHQLNGLIYTTITKYFKCYFRYNIEHRYMLKI